MRLNAVPENLFERIAARERCILSQTKLFRIDRGSDADPTFASSFQPWDRYGPHKSMDKDGHNSVK